MAAQNLAESLDHFVVPVDDIVVAEEFYVRVFGGVITKRNGLNVRQRKRGAVPHTFIQIGGKRMGVYLQSEERTKPTVARGLPTYSFTTTAQGLQAVMADLNELGVRFDGPVRNAHPFADQTLFLTDPAGNHYAVFISSQPPTRTPPRFWWISCCPERVKRSLSSNAVGPPSRSLPPAAPTTSATATPSSLTRKNGAASTKSWCN